MEEHQWKRYLMENGFGQKRTNKKQYTEYKNSGYKIIKILKSLVSQGFE
ncbi:hypothetical protein [Ursidibacter sp. B-7004-1]